MKSFLVEFGFSGKLTQVDEWYAMDGMVFEAISAEEAANEAACTDGLEDAFLRVWELVPNEFGGMEKGEAQYF